MEKMGLLVWEKVDKPVKVEDKINETVDREEQVKLE